jgi:hypothetical protein
MDITLLQQFEASIENAISWLSAHLNDQGALDTLESDLVDYAAIPYLFCMMGHLEKAHRSLNYIHKEFLHHEKALELEAQLQVKHLGSKDELTKVIAWVAHASHLMGRFEISYPLFQHLRRFYMPEQGAFTAIAPIGQAEAVLDFPTTAFLGWVSLYGGDLVKAQRAGNFLQRCFSMQPDMRSAFYLRMDDDGRFITAFDREKSCHHVILRQKTDQAYGELGFAMGMLGKLYAATSDNSYLVSAKASFECAQGLNESHSNIQIAWGAAVLARLTNESRFKKHATLQAEKVLADQQSGGAWQLTSRPIVETATNAIWLAHIVAELSEI